MKHYVLDSEAMIPWFKKAVAWYVENGPKDMPRPTTLPESPLKNIELNGRSSWGAYYIKNEAFSYLDDGSVMLKGLSSHMMPLFAGVHQGYPPHVLAKIIKHHGIEPADFYEIYIGRQGQTLLFTNKNDVQVGLLEFYIEAWKAFEMLGKVTEKDCIGGYLEIAVMHTERKEAWPATLIERQAATVRSGSATKRTFENDFRHRWNINRTTQLPNGSAQDFMRRSGMLSRPAFRKEVVFHTAWEDLCAIAGNLEGKSVAWRVLEDCKNASFENKAIIRDALRSMHLHGMQETIKNTAIYELLSEIFSDDHEFKDVLDSVILKINVTVPTTSPKDYQRYMTQSPEKRLFTDILEDGRTVLAKACKEILSLEPHQIGYAHLVFFSTLERMNLGPQKGSGFSPEKLMLRLDQGITDFLGSRAPSGNIPESMVQGLADAFRELSKYHIWDFTKLQECSSLAQFKMIQEGVNLRDFPKMDRKHRGMLLEEQLGL